MRTAVKAALKDTPLEPPIRWVVKRLRGLRMPYDLVKNEIYDRQATEVMQRVLRPESNCIDIGAHKGQFLREFLRWAPRGRHLAFEPIPRLAEELRSAFPGVEVFNLALSDRPGTASFFVLPETPALSGLSERTFLKPDAVRQAIQVRTERLDALVPSDRRIDLLKIDVEGAEGLVLTGALETLRRCRPFVVFEHGRASSEALGTSSAALYDLLTRRCGLRVSCLANWLHGRRPLTADEFARADTWYFLAHPERAR